MPDGREPTGRLAAGLLAAASGALALLISWQVLDLAPHVTDAISYLFQGRILAAGHLYLPPPPVWPLFAHENIIIQPDRWCSPYAPGWPALLALGWLAHAPWLVDPLLLALAVLGAWQAGRHLYDRRTGLAAAAALACSPFAILMAGDAMAHVPAICTCIWCIAKLAQLARLAELAPTQPARSASPDQPAQSARWCAIAAGLLGAAAFTIRPVTALALLAPALVWCLLAIWRRTASGHRLRPALIALAWMATGAAPLVVGMLAYDHAVFGGALTLGYNITDAHIAHGAAAAINSPRRALADALPWYLGSLNHRIWGFPWGDLPLLLLPILFDRRDRDRPEPSHRATAAMLSISAAALLLTQSFYYYHDVIYSGPRLVFETLGPAALLTGRALVLLRSWLLSILARWRPGASDDGTSQPAPAVIYRLVAGASLALLLFYPLGRRLPEQIRHEAGWYLAVSTLPLRQAAAAGVGPQALVFVAGTPWCYAGFFPANGLDPRHAPRVYVRDIPPLRAAALAAYRRAEVWVVRVEVALLPNARDVAVPTALTWHRLR